MISGRLPPPTHPVLVGEGASRIADKMFKSALTAAALSDNQTRAP